ncbi:MAG: glucuronate isomerase, partial [Pseudolysinimonas sp.]
MAEPLAPHPDRLFPADPATRDIARQLHASVADVPIFSPHGHVDAGMLVADKPFPDAAALLITPDHYVTRVMHSLGVDLADLGVGGSGAPGGSLADPRETWRIFSTHWSAYLGTPSRYWLESELASFGVTEQPSADNADAVFDAIGERLREPDFRPRALFERYGIDVLATTDDPCSDLAAHAALAADAGLAGRVIPTFRPDRYLDPAAPGWVEGIGALTDTSGHDATTFPGYLDALRARRRYFIDHGATATDHGVLDAGSEPLDPATAAKLHVRALAGTISTDEATAYRRGMLFEMARMSTQDGLVMQLHPGILRNHDRATFARFGGDTGHDLPLATSFSEPLRPLLE